MANCRNIQVSFWTDSKVIEDFTPEDKYFYLYLMTNPLTSLCGCYEISRKQMSIQTGYSVETIDNLLYRMQKIHGVACYSKETRELLLVNWPKYNWLGSIKMLNGAYNEAKSIKDSVFRFYLMFVLRERGVEVDPCYLNADTLSVSNDTLSIPYPYPMHTLSIPYPYPICEAIYTVKENKSNINNINNSQNGFGAVENTAIEEENISVTKSNESVTQKEKETKGKEKTEEKKEKNQKKVEDIENKREIENKENIYIPPLYPPQKPEGTDKTLNRERDIATVVDYLNKRIGARYSPKTAVTVKLISGRLSEGRTVEDCKAVIDIKAKEWMGTEMEQYLRPQTLFAQSNFENYLQQKDRKPIARSESMRSSGRQNPMAAIREKILEEERRKGTSG